MLCRPLETKFGKRPVTVYDAASPFKPNLDQFSEIQQLHFENNDVRRSRSCWSYCSSLFSSVAPEAAEMAAFFLSTTREVRNVFTNHIKVESCAGIVLRTLGETGRWKPDYSARLSLSSESSFEDLTHGRNKKCEKICTASKNGNFRFGLKGTHVKVSP